MASDDQPLVESLQAQNVVLAQHLTVQGGILFERGKTSASVSNLTAPSLEDLRQLGILRDRVREFWIDGVLKSSLHHGAILALGKKSIPEAVEHPWGRILELPNSFRAEIPSDRRASEIFDGKEVASFLLVLGEPGSGKTTTMLELASELLDQAERNTHKPIPVVVNLSSWQDTNQCITDWFVGELSTKYRVPSKLGRAWVDAQLLLPLLDGLDEVNAERQSACVNAINQFIDCGIPGLVVCSRLKEYQSLANRLHVNGAICLQSLTPPQIHDYLYKAGHQLEALRSAIQTDSALREFAQSPLMLNIMALAYQSAEASELLGVTSRDERRKQILTAYVDAMYRRKGEGYFGYSKESTTTWLSWLASNMKKHKMSVFTMEELQPSWLHSSAQLVAYGTITALICGANLGLFVFILFLAGELSDGGTVEFETLIDNLVPTLLTGFLGGAAILAGCWSLSSYRNGIVGGIVVALISWMLWGLRNAPIHGVFFGLLIGPGIGSIKRILVIESMSWRWAQFLRRTVPGLMVGLSIGLLVLVVPNRTLYFPREAGLFGMLALLLIYAFVGGLLSGLIGGMTGAVKKDKTLPNQGIRLSFKNAMVAFFGVWLIVGPTAGLSLWLFEGAFDIDELSDSLLGGLTYGMMFGLVGGLNRGGAAVIKHYSLRLFLWLRGNTPFDYIKFLDKSTKLIFLNKVGGGYIFMHRILLDYFADLAPKSDRMQKVS